MDHQWTFTITGEGLENLRRKAVAYAARDGKRCAAEEVTVILSELGQRADRGWPTGGWEVDGVVCSEVTAYLLAVQDLVCACLIIQMQVKGTDSDPEFVSDFDAALQKVLRCGSEMERAQS